MKVWEQEGGSIWATCLECCVKGGGDLKHNKPEGFWMKTFDLFREEGLDVDAFLIEYNSRLERKHDPCHAGNSEWMIDWIAEKHSVVSHERGSRGKETLARFL